MSTPDISELRDVLIIFPNTFLIKLEQSAPFSRAICLGKFLFFFFFSAGQALSCLSLAKSAEFSTGFGICKEIFLWQADRCTQRLLRLAAVG